MLVLCFAVVAFAAAPSAHAQVDDLRIPVKKARIPVGILQGQVLGASGKPAGAKLIAESLGRDVGKQIPIPVDPATGNYEIKLSPGKYRITATAPGHLGAVVEVEVKDRFRSKLPIKLAAEPPKGTTPPAPPAAEITVRYDRDTDAGEAVARSDLNEIELAEKIEYGPNDIMVPNNSFALLDKLVRVLKLDPDYVQVDIVGHAHPYGQEALEQRNSLRRATYVKNYLVQNGIDAARLRIEGKGSAVPRAAGGNDRVEVVLWHLK